MTTGFISENGVAKSKDSVADLHQTPEQATGFPIVGVGASAGGLAAFESFFSGIPTDHPPGMAFVLVQHLAPDHKSLLTEIIARHTALRVLEAKEGMKVESDNIYVIPPNYNMALLDGTIRLSAPGSPRSQSMPIDFFFRSLARDQREQAICVILSGTGSDGTLGLRAVKEEGGISVAQTPETAEYDGMPKSALATGLVDFELDPLEMVPKILSFIRHSHLIRQSSEVTSSIEDYSSRKRVFELINLQTRHDFSQYKPSTINRRIERRLAIHQIQSLDEYAKFLHQTPDEIDALFRDLLIGVTSFFRDKEAFTKLEEDIVPGLFAAKEAGSSIRVWCPGCSTGEEAYSIAILLQEYVEKAGGKHVIQVFGTDIDPHAIAVARKGLYPASISADITPERISRFFTPATDGNGYSVNKSLRNLLIFSEQSIIKDPPFSRMDLISCRNFLIYVNSDLQKKLIPLFHYALNPKGILFLGSSETVGEFEYLFEALDRKLKFYRRKQDLVGVRRSVHTQLMPQALRTQAIIDDKKSRTPPGVKYSLREITEQAVLRESSLAGVLVNERGDILYVHGRTGKYLEQSQGEAGVRNIIGMSREGLKAKLAVALRKSIDKRETVRLTDVNVKTNGHFTRVNVTVRQVLAGPVSASEQPLLVVLFEDVKTQESVPQSFQGEPGSLPDSDKHLEELKLELSIKEDFLQDANDELEASNEQLKASNETMQSMNDELQSTNEELETSKEELQSINEELSTVNAELQAKVHELSKANNDMKNLLSGTNIATIFLDCEQRVLNFTPTARQIINLLSTDIGRPVSHIVANFRAYDGLSGDVKGVLDTLVPKNIQVETANGTWYNMIIQPYRTIENVVEGAVLSFIDITEAKHAKDMLAISEMKYRTLFETAHEGILILDGISGRITNVNPYLLELLGHSEEELLAREVWGIGLLRDVVANREKFAELQKQKHIRYDNLPIETANGKSIAVEFVCNAYEIDHYQFVQCNIREVVKPS